MNEGFSIVRLSWRFKKSSGPSQVHGHQSDVDGEEQTEVRDVVLPSMKMEGAEVRIIGGL